MNNNIPIKEALECLENSFLIWDEKTIKRFIETVMEGWTFSEKGGDVMKTLSKGLCDTCVSDKTCSFPRRFPVHACDEFAQNGGKKIKNKDRVEVRE